LREFEISLGTILIFYINIEHVFQLNILLKITFNAFKMEVNYSKKYLEETGQPVQKKSVSESREMESQINRIPMKELREFFI